MSWGLAVMFTIAGVLALSGIISPNGVRRATGRLVSQEYRRPDLTPRQVLLVRIASVGILWGMAVVLLLEL